MVSESSRTAEHVLHRLNCDFPGLVKEEHRSKQPLLTENEQQQLAAWNATEQEYPTDACVQQLIARQATATSDAVALVANGQALSYHELNRCANQLAHY